MPLIELETIVNAPVQRCFDLARSIDFHQETTAGTNERAVAGVTSGLINKGEEVTWRARHFGVYQHLSSQITEMNAPYYFEDRMIKGVFKSIRHRHFFEEKNGQTIMKDHFEFEAPFGLIGKIISKLILKDYLQKFIVERNQMLKETAESDEWKKYIA